MIERDLSLLAREMINNPVLCSFIISASLQKCFFLLLNFELSVSAISYQMTQM